MFTKLECTPNEPLAGSLLRAVHTESVKIRQKCPLDELLRVSQLTIYPVELDFFSTSEITVSLTSCFVSLNWMSYPVGIEIFFATSKITVHLTGCFLRLSQLTIQPSWDRFFFHVSNNCILNELLRLAQLAFLQSSWNTCFFFTLPNLWKS